MNSIFLIARFNIREGKLEKFKRIASECIEIVKEKESNTLKYDWYFDENQLECAVLEEYRNSEAAMEHMENLGPQLGQLMELADFKAEAYGEMSEELQKTAAELDLKIYSFFNGK